MIYSHHTVSNARLKQEECVVYEIYSIAQNAVHFYPAMIEHWVTYREQNALKRLLRCYQAIERDCCAGQYIGDDPQGLKCGQQCNYYAQQLAIITRLVNQGELGLALKMIINNETVNLRALKTVLRQLEIGSVRYSLSNHIASLQIDLDRLKVDVNY